MNTETLEPTIKSLRLHFIVVNVGYLSLKWLLSNSIINLSKLTSIRELIIINKDDISDYEEFFEELAQTHSNHNPKVRCLRRRPL